MRRPGLLSTAPRTNVLVFVACSLAAGPSSGLAALVPELRVESRYDDNIFQQPHGSNDVASLIRPGLSIDGRTETQFLLLRARRSFVSYSRVRDLVPYTDLGSVLYSRTWSQASTFDVDYRYSRSRDPLDLGPAAVPNRGDLARTYATGRVEVWRGEVEGRLNRWDYERPTLADGDSRYWAASVFPIRSQAGVVLAGYRSNRLELAGKNVLESRIGSVGWRRSHTPRLRSEAQIGVAYVDYKDGKPEHRKLAGLVDVAAGGDPQVSPNLHVRFAHDITTTMEAELSRDWSLVQASAKWERELDVEGGVYRDPTRTHRWTLGASDTLASGKILALEGSYGRTRPLRGDGTRVKVYRASATFTVPVLPWLNQETQYDFIQQGGLDSRTGIDYRRSRIALSLTAVLR